MIKVLQCGLATDDNIGGVENYLINQFRELDKSKINYDFIHAHEKPIAFEKELEEKCEIFRVPRRRVNPVAYYIGMIALFFGEIKKRKYKAIVVNMPSLSQAIPLLLAKLINIPMRVAHSHTSGVETKVSLIRKFLYFINRIVVRTCATDLWACSQQSGEYLFHTKNFLVIHNAIKAKDFLYNASTRGLIRDKLGIKNEFVIGHVGRFSPVKNQMFLLDVLKKLRDEGKSVVLLLVGNNSPDGGYPEYVSLIHEKINEYKIKEFVIFTGFTKETSKYYQAMDMFAMPSISEGLPMAIVEAQAADLPCILSYGITNEADIIHDVMHLDLSTKEWSENICKYIDRGRERKNNLKLLLDSGYDVSQNAKTVEKLLECQNVG